MIATTGFSEMLFDVERHVELGSSSGAGALSASWSALFVSFQLQHIIDGWPNDKRWKTMRRVLEAAGKRFARQPYRAHNQRKTVIEMDSSELVLVLLIIVYNTLYPDSDTSILQLES